MVSLKWAAKVIVKELFTNLDRFARGSSSVVFLREESLGSFVAARRAWNVVLFSSGRKVFYLYCSLPLEEFGTSCCFPQGGKSSIVFFVAARPVWNVVPFPSGRKDFVYYRSTGRLV